MEKQSLVSIVTVNWNDLKHLKGYFKSIYNQNYSNFEIIISDNGSVDGSLEFIKKEYPKTVLIENGENIGPSEARNRAIKYVKGKYVQFLDNDVEVDKNFLVKSIKRFEEDKTIGAIQNRLMVMGTDKIDFITSYFTVTGFFQYEGVREKFSEKYNQEKEIFSCKSAGMVVTKEALDKTALYDPDMFIYVEDTDLIWQVWLAGYRVIYLPSSVVNHASGSTATKDRLIKVDYLSFRNRILTLIKHLETKNLLYILPFHLILVVGVSIMFLLSGRPQSTWALLRAIGWNFQHWGKTMKKRKIVQTKVRKVSDASIFAKVKKPFDLGFYFYWTKNYLTRWKDFGWSADRPSREIPEQGT